MKNIRSLTFVLTALALAACGRDATTPAAVSEIPEMPADNVMFDSRHLITKDGLRNAELKADTAYVYENEDRVDMIGVRMRFFTESGGESGTLTAETGEYMHRGGQFVARGNVVLVAETPDQGRREIRTEELSYDVDADLLSSDVPFVSIMQDGSTVRGTSFRSDSKFQSFRVERAQTSGAGGGNVTF